MLTLSFACYITPTHILRPFLPTWPCLFREETFIPIVAFRFHAHLSLDPFARCCSACTRQTRGDGYMEEAVPASQSNISCTWACVPLYGPARFHGMHIFAVDTPRASFICMLSCGSPRYTSRASRVSSRTRLCRSLSSSGPSMSARR
jgi:hypothetical protein